METDFFLSRFQFKTDNELQEILNGGDSYTIAAKQAAGKILEDRKALRANSQEHEKVTIPLKNSATENIRKPQKMGIHPFDPTPYLRSWGLKDLITHLSIGTTWLAIFELMIYYSSEPLIYSIIKVISIGLYLATLVINHVLYRKDHDKSNNYFGRCLSDLGSLVIFGILVTIYHALMSDSFNPLISNPEDMIALALSFFLIFMGIEAIISLFKYLFRFLKWRIL